MHIYVCIYFHTSMYMLDCAASPHFPCTFRYCPGTFRARSFRVHHTFSCTSTEVQSSQDHAPPTEWSRVVFHHLFPHRCCARSQPAYFVGAEKGDSNSHGARPVHLIITIRTSGLSMKTSRSALTRLWGQSDPQPSKLTLPPKAGQW